MGNEKTGYTPEKLLALVQYWAALSDDLDAANDMLEHETMRVLGLSSSQWGQIQNLLASGGYR